MKAVFVVLSIFIGALVYAVIAVATAAVDLAIWGEGPHGMGGFAYIGYPMMFAPVGAVTGLIVSLLIKQKSYKSLLKWLVLLAIPWLAAYFIFVTFFSEIP